VTVDHLRELIATTDTLVLVYFLGLNGFYAMLLVLSVPQLWRHWETYKDEHLTSYLSADSLPPITIVVPAYNMEQSICETTECLLSLQYSRHEVIIVNDGSTDKTLDRLRERYDLYEIPPVFRHPIPVQPIQAYYRSRIRPDLVVLDKLNGGKADSHNAAVGVARFPLLILVDADTLLDHDALIRLARVFLLDPHVAGAGATIRIANGCVIRSHEVDEPRVSRNYIAGMQVPEYLRAFLFGRLGFNPLGGNLIVSGAFGIFRKDVLVEIAGFNAGSVAEDLDLCVRLHKHLLLSKRPYSVPFVPDPIAWTEAPEDLATLASQRERWHRGLIATIWLNRDMLFNPRYGRVGMITLPFFALGEMLAPVVEAFGIVITAAGLWFGIIDWRAGALFLAACWGYGMLLTVASVVLEEVTFRCYPRLRDFLLMILYAVLEPFGYRQLTLVWRLRGFWSAWRGSKSWGVMKRRGFASAQA